LVHPAYPVPETVKVQVSVSKEQVAFGSKTAFPEISALGEETE
jgi:hypothetical protein